MDIRIISKRTIRIVKIALVTLTILFLLTTCGLILWFDAGYEPQTFSREAWAEADSENRGYMLKSLLTTTELEGLTQSEALKLLGTPDDLGIEGIEDSWAPSLSVSEVVMQYGSLEAVRLDYLSYDIGHLGTREGTPFRFPYHLYLLLEDGVVNTASYDD